MAGIEALVQTSELKTGRLASAEAKHPAKRIYSFHYDDLSDTLSILLVPPQEDVVVHYLDDHVGFLCEEDSLEIVGLQIESFESVIMPQSQSIQRVWLNVHSTEIKNFGQLTLAFERAQPSVVREVVKATRDILGAPGEQIEALVAA